MFPLKEGLANGPEMSLSLDEAPHSFTVPSFESLHRYKGTEGGGGSCKPVPSKRSRSLRDQHFHVFLYSGDQTEMSLGWGLAPK